MKNQDGVSLFEVIIAIIILLIIAFFAIYNSRNSVAEAKATEVFTEMKSVEAAVEFVRTQMVTKDGFKLEKGKHYDEPDVAEIVLDDFNQTIVIYGMLNHPDCPAAMHLGLEGLKRDYEVNYETGSFGLKEAVDIQGTKVKTIAEVNSLLNGGIK